jgi:hypothetical protein
VKERNKKQMKGERKTDEGIDNVKERKENR